MTMTYAQLKASLPPFVTKMITEIIRVEAGYVNDPSDSGGPTRYGITEKVARADGYQGDMRDLPEERAFSIYLRRYYNAPKFDEVAKHSEPMAEELTDTGVNMGQSHAARFLQTALNIVSYKEGKPLYADVPINGTVSSATIGALILALAAWQDTQMVKMLNCLQGARYIDIAARLPRNRKFCYGWLSHRVALPQYAAMTTVQAHSDYAAIKRLSPNVAIELTDIRHSHDAYTANTYVQRCLNSLNSDKRALPMYAQLVVDGDLGRNSLNALAAFIKVRGLLEGTHQLVKALNCMQGALMCSNALADLRLRPEVIEWFKTRIQMPIH